MELTQSLVKKYLCDIFLFTELDVSRETLFFFRHLATNFYFSFLIINLKETLLF